MTTPTPGRLTVGKDGRITGPAAISYNTPWPLKFAKAGVTGKMSGALLHTMDGSLVSCIQTFNSPDAQGSAHFGISQTGRIHQFVPLGQGYETFHAFAANQTFYGIETEDQGDLEHHAHVDPISDAGLWAWAQLLECLASFAGFPLQVTDSCSGHGLAYHRMCHDWNLSGHTCPGATMTDDVRVNQRAEIVKRALKVRAAAKGVQWKDYVVPSPNTLSLLDVATAKDVQASQILRETAVDYGRYAPPLSGYINAGDLTAALPAGAKLRVPA